MSDDRSILEDILDPLDETTFFRDYWTRKPVRLARGDRTRFDGVFDLADLEEYLFVARPPVGDVQLVRNGQWPPLKLVSGLLVGQHYDVQTIYNGLSDGYTIVLNAVHYRWPSMKRLATQLEDQLLARVQTNVYITGPNAQGFGLHQDDHDVFVLQTVGTKRWEVRNNPASQTAGDQDPLLHGFELNRGDALYLPAGTPHAAATTRGFSVHVSVGIFPFTWQQLAHECIDFVANGDSRWREPVPLGEGSTPAVSTLERRLRDALSTLADLSPVVDVYRRQLTASARRKNPPPDGYMRSMSALQDLDLQTEVEWRHGVGCYVTTDATSALIHFMGETIRGPAVIESALRFIAATPRFRVNQVDATLPDASKLVLIRRLLREGLLQLTASLADP